MEEKKREAKTNQGVGLRSKAWHLTYPLRKFFHLVKRSFCGVWLLVKGERQRLINLIMTFFLLVEKSKYKKTILKILIKFPSVKERLKKLFFCCASSRESISFDGSSKYLSDNSELSLNHVDYFYPLTASSLAVSYNLDIDFELIYLIRKKASLATPYLDKDDYIEKVIVHIFLAFLKRVPENYNTQHYIHLAKRDSSFDIVFKSIFDTDEFAVSGYRVVYK
ncbi:hypothetical protein [Desulfogranum marinum]|uniref:hypothetical protein n=1 Tax=Desulfogranum marinum TaxID=453220 RepID=UPI0019636BB6|nr:hypothetical protein [Desulfogranum marinum]MBM9513024.1 hypothetical protein [Desulfogranum marinum]